MVSPPLPAVLTRGDKMPRQGLDWGEGGGEEGREGAGRWQGIVLCCVPLNIREKVVCRGSSIFEYRTSSPPLDKTKRIRRALSLLLFTPPYPPPPASPLSSSNTAQRETWGKTTSIAATRGDMERARRSMAKAIIPTTRGPAR